MRNRFQKLFRFLLNPKLLICVVLAWFITNGWSYLLFGVGTWFQIGWMTAVAGAYITFLWLPVSPEKIVTLAIAIALLRWLFPNDIRTLAVLKKLHEKAKRLASRRKKKSEKRTGGK